MDSNVESKIKDKAWHSLKEACEYKGLNYKTACNNTILQPNCGIAEGKIGGKKKMWKNTTILEWLYLTDDEIKKNIA